MAEAAKVTQLGKIGFWFSLVPWLVLPILLAIPKGAAQPPAAGQPPSTAYTFSTISFVFYCFSPIALLASIAGLTSDASKKYAIAGAIISGLFYLFLIVLYAGHLLPALPRP